MLKTELDNDEREKIHSILNSNFERYNGFTCDWSVMVSLCHVIKDNDFFIYDSNMKTYIIYMKFNKLYKFEIKTYDKLFAFPFETSLTLKNSERRPTYDDYMDELAFLINIFDVNKIRCFGMSESLDFLHSDSDSDSSSS